MGRRLGIALAFMALGTIPLSAASSQIWKNRTRAEREQGDLKGVSLAADGMLSLGPSFEMISSVADPYLWSLARDSHGTVYAGGGNDGKVYRLGKDKKLEVFYDAGELEVHCLAIDARDNLYVGTSPRGKIYRVTPSGKAEEFFVPGETYIWSLLFDAKGNLYAGTGTQGRIYRISPSGKGEVFLDTEETHIRVLALAKDGKILAGTDGKGMVLRVDPSGKSTVLSSAPLPEVTALIAGSDGHIYFSAVGQGSRPAPRPPPPAPPARPPSPSGEDAPAPPQPEGQPPQPAPPAQAPPPASPGVGAVEGKVLALETDGYTREIWGQSGEIILALAEAKDGAVLAGGGSDGKIYRIDPVRAETTLLNKADSSQITSFLREPGGSVLASGGNLGALFRIGGRVASEGTFQSNAFDAKVFSSWGKMTWRSEDPSGTSIRIQVRTGNTPEPDASWSEWSAPLEQKDGSLVDRPKARYVQWRATLHSSEGKASPRLGEVALNFLQRNLPPEVKSVEVQAPGIVFQKPNKSPAMAAAPGDGATSAARGDREKGAHRAVQQPRPQSDKEGRAAQWGATDPNGDDLLFTVYYRGTDEKDWKLMEKDLTDPFFSWDATSMADGIYLLRVVAEDSPSNPENSALSAERLSDPFDVDNNPPRIGPIRAEVSGASARLLFEVSDSFSNMGEVIYSVNAREWEVATPQDGITDSPVEQYRLDLAGLAPGEVTVVIKASDSAGNSSTAKTVLKVGSQR
jgi:hypothetical protein